MAVAIAAASCLDPWVRIEMRSLIKRRRQERKTIMLSSHILPELVEICNTLGIIERRKLIFNGSGGEAEEQVRNIRGGRVFLVSVCECNADAAKKLGGYKEVSPAVLDAKSGVVRVALRAGQDDGNFIPERLIAQKFKLHSFCEEEISIEHIVLHHEGHHELKRPSVWCGVQDSLRD